MGELFLLMVLSSSRGVWSSEWERSPGEKSPWLPCLRLLCTELAHAPFKSTPKRWLGRTTTQIVGYKDSSLPVQLSSWTDLGTYPVPGNVPSTFWVLTHLILETVTIPSWKQATWGAKKPCLTQDHQGGKWQSRIQAQAVYYRSSDSLATTFSVKGFILRHSVSEAQKLTTETGQDLCLDAAPWWPGQDRSYTVWEMTARATGKRIHPRAECLQWMAPWALAYKRLPQEAAVNPLIEGTSRRVENGLPPWACEARTADKPPADRHPAEHHERGPLRKETLKRDGKVHVFHKRRRCIRELRKADHGKHYFYRKP